MMLSNDWEVRFGVKERPREKERESGKKEIFFLSAPSKFKVEGQGEIRKFFA